MDLRATSKIQGEVTYAIGFFPPQDALDPKNEANTSVAEPLVEVILNMFRT